MKTPSVSSRLPRNAHIHIDWMTVTGPCRHAPIGRISLHHDKELGIIPTYALAKNAKLREDGGLAELQSKEIGRDGLANRLEIKCCPPKVLQRHNVFGHASLAAYVAEIFDRVAQYLGIDVEPEDREAWHKGAVLLTEVHLTGNFCCPRELILPIIDAIDDNNRDGKKRDCLTSISLGWTEKGRSKHHLASIYDKMLELLTSWLKPGPKRRRIIDCISDAIRAEIKIFSKGLNYRKLQYVADWHNVDVAALFFELLESYGIQYAIQPLLSDEQLETLTLKERNVYKAWLRGESVKSIFKSRSSVKKYVDAIEAKTGHNIRGDNRPELDPPIHLKDIFCPENLLPVPNWMIGTDMYVSGCSTPPRSRCNGISNAPLPDVIPEDMVIEVDGELRVI